MADHFIAITHHDAHGQLFTAAPLCRDIQSRLGVFALDNGAVDIEGLLKTIVHPVEIEGIIITHQT
jgi:hypothetical protein